MVRPEVDEDEREFLESLKCRKKAKTKRKKSEEANTEQCDAYPKLLARLYDALQEMHPDTMDARKKTLVPPPQLIRMGKKSNFVNFPEFPKALNRPPDHFMSFILSELGVTGNLDGERHMLLNGRFQAKHMETQVRRYISEYVQCLLCKGINTTMTKDPHTRLHQLVCMKCSATRNLSPIQQGYAMRTRQQRRAAAQ
eukprot:TRINITY_DN7277_c0_g1_i1.p1 TRINITY_DN7277_c0_g1~~TRINITY_DN7277_c0_g1_i1.p1  ORF type:complete len:197 (-),score=25.30 TRINITY_DN7277_c0_g1_i1:94-684(-)